MLTHILLLWGIIGVCVICLLIFFVADTLTKGELIKWSRLLFRCPKLINYLKTRRRQYFRSIGIAEFDSDSEISVDSEEYDEQQKKRLEDERSKKRRKKIGEDDKVKVSPDLLQSIHNTV